MSNLLSLRYRPTWPSARAFCQTSRVVGVVLLLCVSVRSQAQETPTPPADPPQEARSTGLPEKVSWAFNLDGGFGAFGFANSLYTNNRPDPSGNLDDNWFEGFVKPALSATYQTGSSELYGKVSVVGERTYGAAPSLVGEDASSYKEEDLFIGWRSGTSMSSTENLLDLTVGRTQYKIGHGFLVWDGGGEGGNRGGFWSNARKAWQFAAVARLQPKHHTFEVFYLDRDEVPGSDTGSTLAGVNYDLAAGERSTFGVSYIKTFAKQDLLPGRDEMNVFHARAYTAPFRALSGLSFELEYAYEKNGDLMNSTAWSAQAAYQLSNTGWQPRISYRYAYFGGDDPATTESEAFDSLFLGFSDWGAWWQGEIAGEYFLSNSNNISHQVRLHLTPSEPLSCGVMGYLFQLPEPASFGTDVTSKDVAIEFDAYADWQINDNFLLSLVGAYADPQQAVEQGYGRTEAFTYGMAYLAYSY
jgi:hypothetical protein